MSTSRLCSSISDYNVHLHWPNLLRPYSLLLKSVCNAYLLHSRTCATGYFNSQSLAIKASVSRDLHIALMFFSNVKLSSKTAPRLRADADDCTTELLILREANTEK